MLRERDKSTIFMREEYLSGFVEGKQPSTVCRRKPLHTGVSTSDQ